MSYDVERGRPYQGGAGGNSGFVARDGQREDPLVSSLKENIKQIQNNVTSLTKFATSLGTPKDSAENRAKLYDSLYLSNIDFVSNTITEMLPLKLQNRLQKQPHNK